MSHTPQPVISTTGLFTPAERIANEELVASFNAYVALHNRENAAAIAAGEIAELTESSVEFIEKARWTGLISMASVRPSLSVISDTSA